SPPERSPLCVPVRSSKDHPGGTPESVAARQDCAHKGLRRQVRMVYYVVKDEVWRSERDVGVANTNLGSTEQVLAAVRGPLKDDRMRAQQMHGWAQVTKVKAPCLLDLLVRAQPGELLMKFLGRLAARKPVGLFEPSDREAALGGRPRRQKFGSVT